MSKLPLIKKEMLARIFGESYSQQLVKSLEAGEISPHDPGVKRAWKSVITQRLEAGQIDAGDLNAFNKSLRQDTPGQQVTKAFSPAPRKSIGDNVAIYKGVEENPYREFLSLRKDASESDIAKRTTAILKITRDWDLKDDDIYTYINVAGLDAVEQAISSLRGAKKLSKAAPSVSATASASTDKMRAAMGLAPMPETKFPSKPGVNEMRKFLNLPSIKK